MTITDTAKKLAAQNKYMKWAILLAIMVAIGYGIVTGHKDDVLSLVQIGEEVATVKVDDGHVTGIVSSSAMVSVTEVSSTVQ